MGPVQFTQFYFLNLVFNETLQQLLYSGTNPILEKNLVPEIWAKIFLANQILGFQQCIIWLPNALSSLSAKNISLKKFIIFFPKITHCEKSFILSQKKLIFQKRYVQNPGITELSYIFEKVYSEPWHNGTFLYFQKWNSLALILRNFLYFRKEKP